MTKNASGLRDGFCEELSRVAELRKTMHGPQTWPNLLIPLREDIVGGDVKTARLFKPTSR